MSWARDLTMARYMSGEDATDPHENPDEVHLRAKYADPVDCERSRANSITSSFNIVSRRIYWRLIIVKPSDRSGNMVSPYQFVIKVGPRQKPHGSILIRYRLVRNSDRINYNERIAGMRLDWLLLQDLIQAFHLVCSSFQSCQRY